MSAAKQEAVADLSRPAPSTHTERDIPHGPRVLRKMLALTDFEEPARRYLPRPIFGYIAGGVETDTTRLANRAAFADWAFVPRMLMNTSERTQKATIFGRTYDAPFGFCPMGGISM